MKPLKVTIGFLAIASMLVSACSKESKPKTDVGNPIAPVLVDSAVNLEQKILPSFPIQTWESLGDLSPHPLIIIDGLKEIFCANAYSHDLKANFDQVLGVVCTDKKPNTMFEQFERLASSNRTGPRSARLTFEHTDDGYSKGLYVVVYFLPTVPKWIRASAFVDYLYRNTSFEYLQFNGKVLSNQSASVAGSLQFGKWEMAAELAVTPIEGKSFATQRTTEMNSFQVKVGNPNVGLGAERLVSSVEGGFRQYQTATITLGNADLATTTMITLINVDTKNHGYPETAEQVFTDIVQAQGEHVYRGIVSEYEKGNFNPDQQR